MSAAIKLSCENVSPFSGCNPLLPRGKVVFQPPGLVSWWYDQTTPMPAMSVHQNVGCPTIESSLCSLSLRVAATTALALDAASVARAVAMPRARPQRAGDCPRDQVASPAGLAGPHRVADRDGGGGAARGPGHRGGRRDLRGRLVAQSPASAARSHESPGTGHYAQDAGLRDSLPRRAGVGPSRAEREPLDPAAVDPSTGAHGDRKST